MPENTENLLRMISYFVLLSPFIMRTQPVKPAINSGSASDDNRKKLSTKMREGKKPRDDSIEGTNRFNMVLNR